MALTAHDSFFAALCITGYQLSWVVAPGEKNADVVPAKFNLVQAPLPGGALLKKGDHRAIGGDSITGQKRYSWLIEDCLTACPPELQVTVRQNGRGGERAGGFLIRDASIVLQAGQNQNSSLATNLKNTAWKTYGRPAK